jgi:hypothetical protein
MRFCCARRVAKTKIAKNKLHSTAVKIHHDWIVGGVLQSFIAIPILIFSFYNAHVCFQKIPAEMTDTVLLYRFLLVQYILGFLALVVTSMCMLGAKDGIYGMVRRKDEGDVMWYYRKIGE